MNGIRGKKFKDICLLKVPKELLKELNLPLFLSFVFEQVFHKCFDTRKPNLRISEKLIDVFLSGLLECTNLIYFALLNEIYLTIFSLNSNFHFFIKPFFLSELLKIQNQNYEEKI
ncbi:hypothetical protein BpHYR1_036031 [Brachionus plicatilis]|uniref:Uncharacterized protein n=1 Tax=Brachionus plicatilis TaxID=10195 RepID=A0A3M7SLJ7_BRAPC|nr:hypothetical protein BpHYR1_036031 [Brachionus plicatilis]